MNDKFIVCPHCNYQYLPGEIFSPIHFIGQPKNIVRNHLGEILGYEGLQMDTVETYNCENCHKDFEVSAKIKFLTNSEQEAEADAPSFEQLSLF